MSKHITKNDWNIYSNIINVGNGSSYLLSFQKRKGYNAGLYGWNYDLYVIYCNGKNIAILKGYRVPYKIHDTKLLQRYEEMAYNIISDHSKDYQQQKEEVNELLLQFIKESTA